ncbi:MAG: LamG domain-containing protein, partial [bacterium]|nr:LamG domain-containing protein [bacterium]
MSYGFLYTLPTISGTHSDFPVLLKTADFPSAAIDGTANAIDNGGGNLIAYTSSAKTTQLPVEVVTFVSSGSPDAEVWVKTGTAETSGTIYIEADAVQSSQPAVTATYGRNAVWAAYEAVYHLKTVSSIVDATGNGNTGTNTGTVGAAGAIGSGADFDSASGDVINLGTGIDNIFASGGCFSVWATPSSNGEGGYGRIAETEGSSDSGWLLFCRTESGGKIDLRFIRRYTTTDGQWDATSALTTSADNLVHVNYTDTTSTNPDIYINSSLQTESESRTPSGSVQSDASNTKKLGNRYGDDRQWDGVLDEVRYKKATQSAD